MVQDGEGGGQWVVERMDLEQVRTGEVNPHTHICTQYCMHGRIWNTRIRIWNSNMQHPGILGSDQSEISPLLCTLPNRMSRTLWLQYYSNCM